MKTHEVTQGTREWHLHRAMFRNASDAPAMMGCSPYKTRTQLLQECATGIVAEVDAATQRRFDDGHRFEALARPLAEKIIGQELYPVVGSSGRLSASFDGLTMLEDIAFEHKSLNDELRAIMVNGFTEADLPLVYRIQMQQQCMVAGCELVLFMASKWDGDELVEERHCWYENDRNLAAAIEAGWDQFERDLAEFKPAEAAVEVVGSAIESLPALVVTVEGRVTASNLIAFRESADRFIAKIKTDLQTDQDFADAEQTVKFCKDGEDRLALVKQQALAQTASIEELFRTIDHISEQMRQKRLALDKLVKNRKETIRAEIVAEAQAALDAHIVSLNTRLGAGWMPRTPGGFGEAIKGKKTVASVRDAVSTALAHAKIAASATADKLETNRKSLMGDGHDWFFLFADFATAGTRDPETFSAVAAQRIAQHKEAEQRRRDAELAAQRAESERLEKLAEERRARIEAEVEAEIKALNAEAKALGVRLPGGDDAEDYSITIGLTGPAHTDTYLPASTAAAPLKPAAEVPTVSLSIIAKRLGFALPGAFIEQTLKMPPAGRQGAAVLWRESDWPAIKQTLCMYVETLP